MSWFINFSPKPLSIRIGRGKIIRAGPGASFKVPKGAVGAPALVKAREKHKVWPGLDREPFENDPNKVLDSQLDSGIVGTQEKAVDSDLSDDGVPAVSDSDSVYDEDGADLGRTVDELDD